MSTFSSQWTPLRALETRRLLLRAFREEDAEDLYAYAKNPRIGPPAGWSPHESIDESRRIIRMFLQSDYTWAIVLKETGHVIGSIDLHRDTKRSIEASRLLGYVLEESYWGRGITAEAAQAVIRFGFEVIRLDIIGAIHFPFNLQSKRVMEKCGLRYEGTLRMSTRVFSGEVYDDVCYSITREEWLAR